MGMSHREELKKALEHCLKREDCQHCQKREECENCPYKDACWQGHELKLDALFCIENMEKEYEQMRLGRQKLVGSVYALESENAHLKARIEELKMRLEKNGG